jgi:cytochrome c
MPIGAPFSLTPDEVYALSAYILSNDGIISSDFELNQHSLSTVTMPNRDGFISRYPK